MSLTAGRWVRDPGRVGADGWDADFRRWYGGRKNLGLRSRRGGLFRLRQVPAPRAERLGVVERGPRRASSSRAGARSGSGACRGCGTATPPRRGSRRAGRRTTGRSTWTRLRERLVAGMDERDGVVAVVLERGVGRGGPDRLVVDEHLGVRDVRFDDEAAVDATRPRTSPASTTAHAERPPERHRVSSAPGLAIIRLERGRYRCGAGKVNPTRASLRENSRRGTARGPVMA